MDRQGECCPRSDASQKMLSLEPLSSRITPLGRGGGSVTGWCHYKLMSFFRSCQRIRGVSGLVAAPPCTGPCVLMALLHADQQVISRRQCLGPALAGRFCMQN